MWAGGAARRAQTGFGLVAQGDVPLDGSPGARGSVSCLWGEQREKVAGRGRGTSRLLPLQDCSVCFTWWPVSLGK